MKALTVTFHLTHLCNLRCTYCYTGEKLHIPMSLQTANQGVDFVLDQAKQGQVEFLKVSFIGGEPLIELDLLLHICDRLIHECEPQVTPDFSLSTNGTLLTVAALKRLSDRSVYVSLSVDGTPEAHDLNRRYANGKPSSGKVQTAAHLLLKTNPCANVTCVISPNTAAHVAASAEWLYQLGFRYINLTLDYSADWTMADMDVLHDSYHALAKWYEQKMALQSRFYLSCFDERITSHTSAPPTTDERCYLAYKQFSIAPDGALYPCVQFVTTHGAPEFMIGHLDHGGFDADCRSHIHTCSEQAKPECAGCSLQGRCASWCACINYASTGTITQASPVVCYHEKFLIPLVDEMAERLWKKRNAVFMHKFYNPDYQMIDYFERASIYEK